MVRPHTVRVEIEEIVIIYSKITIRKLNIR